jgi:hypothetical protein
MEDNSAAPAPSTGPVSSVQSQNIQSQRKRIILFAGIGLVILLSLVAGIFILSTTSIDTTSRIRDIFIILMALEFLVIGLALIILVVQLATLINLLQNEIKPILNSTNETVNTLRGTASFLSDNLVEPVIKLNEYLAGLKRLIDLVRPIKR